MAILTTLMSVALSAGVALPLAPDEPLQAALRERYPTVTRWDITPVGTAQSVGPAGYEAPVVTQLGPRSAVRLGKRVQWYAVRGFRPVIVATRRVASGETLNRTVGAVAEINVLNTACEPLLDASALEGKRARKLLRADQAICTDAIEALPVIARGDEVTVHYVNGPIVLTTQGIAQSDGGLGQPLSVLNPRSRQAFRATVTGAREVEVHE